VVQVGEVLAVIGEAGEAGDAGQVAVPGGGDAAPIVGTLPTMWEKSQNETQNETSPGRRGPNPAGEALPLVRKLAKDLDVDLSALRGTGPTGRITKEDVEAAARAPAPPSAPGGGANPAEERVRLSKLRRTIAERMTRSWREIPHVTTFGEADATALLAHRKDLDAPMEALFIQAVVPALRAHPEFNASLDGDDLVLKRRYDIGVAVDTSDGLVVAVVRQADGRPPADLAAEVDRVTRVARSRTATSQELSGQTFTISNIGAVGGGFGTPIIPYGTTAILSFGRAREQPVVRDGRVEVAPVLPISLSYDHRVIDGALGRRFLAAVIEELERRPG
jgi:pyruvate dehydrogenase E2 component (dihydrolipoamide acetyltransferase)